MRSTTVTSVALATLALVASATPASPLLAQLAPGSTLTFTGSANATDLGSPGVLLDFLGRVTADRAGTTGGFATLLRPGEAPTGAIQNLTVGSGPQEIRKVLQFGPYMFDLTHLPSGAYGQTECYVAPAVGQRCTPYQFPGTALSPFYLENVSTPGTDGVFTALIAFDVAGTVTANGVTSSFLGTIGTTFVGASFQEALAGLEAYGLPAVPFTGRFVVLGAEPAVAAASFAASTHVSVTPEPSTVLLLATGMLGVGVLARRRTRGTRV